MKLQFKIDINIAVKKILREQLDKLNLEYDIIGVGEVAFKKELSEEEQKQIKYILNDYGIELVESQKNVLVQKIKDIIIEMVYLEDKLPAEKNSAYLVDKLNHRYGYLAGLFSEVTFTSIENFTIMQKIERAKHLIVNDGLTLTEVAYKLNYSSVAHLSSQFKKVTGLTPTAFQRIIGKRRDIAQTDGEMIN